MTSKSNTHTRCISSERRPALAQSPYLPPVTDPPDKQLPTLGFWDWWVLTFDSLIFAVRIIGPKVL